MGFKGRARKDLRDYRKRGRKLWLRSREKGGRDPRLVWKEVVFGNSYGKRIYREWVLLCQQRVEKSTAVKFSAGCKNRI